MSDDYQLVERAIAWLEERQFVHPSLADLSAAMGTSPFHLQRVFKRWAGVSPKRFLQLLTLEDAKERLRRGASLLDAAYAVGLSGSSRLYDHFVVLEAMTPGEWARGGANLSLRWGPLHTPFGGAIIAWSARGICGLEFLSVANSATALVAGWRRAWPAAEWILDAAGAKEIGQRLFSSACADPVQLWVKGSNFQVQVWRALLRLPVGHATSYGVIARQLGMPGAARAVGTAVGANPVALLIPCHRVLRASGALGGYRWDTKRKRALMAWEAAREAEDALDHSG